MTSDFGDPEFRVHGTGEYDADNAPVLWRNKWLEDHPGGTITRPAGYPSELEASVDGTVLACAFTMSMLMGRTGRAEAEGRCPRHPEKPS